MIAKEFEDYLLQHEDTFLTPGENLAVMIDTHNVDHAILLLSQMTYSRIPVVTAEKKFVGTISLTDIMAYRMKHELAEEEFMSMDIVHMTRKDGLTVEPDYQIADGLHKLVDESFLPVVDKKQHFYGIITRKSILKAVNSLMHTFTSQYEISKK